MTKLTLQQLIIRLIKLLLGFAIIAVGIVMMKNANLGMNPWGTFHLGVHLKTGISFGQVSQLTGLLIIGIASLLKIYPGLGTVLNMFLIGAFIDVVDYSSIIPTSEDLFVQLLMITVGTLLFSYGIYYYLMTGFGGGPRDGLMIGLVKITHQPVRYIKAAIELIVIIIGFFLGGTIGIGTIIAVFLGSFSLDYFFSRKKINPKDIPRIHFRSMTIK